MVAIPGAPEFVFTVSGVEIEGEDSVGVDVQYPWEDSPRRHHSHPMKIEPFYLDKFPVTNKQFKAFLTATGYQPADAGNFLRNWSNGDYPAGQDNKPVTWVSHRGCAGVCEVGRQAASARMGMAVRGARDRWT